MTARRHASIAALSLAALLAAAGSAAAETGACRDDLIKADQNFHRSRANLQQAATGAPAVKCTAYPPARRVAQRGARPCSRAATPGRTRPQNAAQTNAAIAEFTKQMRETCPAGGAKK